MLVSVLKDGLGLYGRKGGRFSVGSYGRGIQGIEVISRVKIGCYMGDIYGKKVWRPGWGSGELRGNCRGKTSDGDFGYGDTNVLNGSKTSFGVFLGILYSSDLDSHSLQ